MIVLSHLMVTLLLDVIELISWVEACVHYIKSSIPFKVLQDLQDEYFESLWLYLRPYKLPRGFSCLIVCVIYHPPAGDNNALIDHITSKLDLALIKHPNAGIFLVGDFNRCPDLNRLSSNPQGKRLP